MYSISGTLKCIDSNVIRSTCGIVVDTFSHSRSLFLVTPFICVPHRFLFTACFCASFRQLLFFTRDCSPCFSTKNRHFSTAKSFVFTASHLVCVIFQMAQLVAFHLVELFCFTTIVCAKHKHPPNTTLFICVFCSLHRSRSPSCLFFSSR